MFLRLLTIIGIITFAAGLSPAEAKHDGWGHPGKHGWGQPGKHKGWYKHGREIRGGTWAGISTHGSITAGIEVPAFGAAEMYTCVPKTVAVGIRHGVFVRRTPPTIRSERDHRPCCGPPSDPLRSDALSKP
jgi:hypothetical protein